MAGFPHNRRPPWLATTLVSRRELFTSNTTSAPGCGPEYPWQTASINGPARIICSTAGHYHQAVAIAVKGHAQVGILFFTLAIKSVRLASTVRLGRGWGRCRPGRNTGSSPGSRVLQTGAAPICRSPHLPASSTMEISPPGPRPNK